MPAGSGRPLNKGQRVMNRDMNLPYGSGSRAAPGKVAGNIKGEIVNGKSKLRTADAAKKFDTAFKGKGYKPPLKSSNYGPKKGK